MANNKLLNQVAMVLLLLAGLNLGLGLIGFDLHQTLLGGFPMIYNIVAGATGLSAIYLAWKTYMK